MFVPAGGGGCAGGCVNELSSARYVPLHLRAQKVRSRSSFMLHDRAGSPLFSAIPSSPHNPGRSVTKESTMPRHLLSLVIGLALASAAWAFDPWPQWRGPNRDGVSAEKGLLDRWEEAPPLVWKAEGLGSGYAGAVVDRRHRLHDGGPQGQTDRDRPQRQGRQGTLGDGDRRPGRQGVRVHVHADDRRRSGLRRERRRQPGLPEDRHRGARLGKVLQAGL